MAENIGATLQEKLEALAQLETREQRGETVPQLAARLGVSGPTLYYWRAQHAQGKLGDSQPGKTRQPDNPALQGTRIRNAKYPLELMREVVRGHLDGISAGDLCIQHNIAKQSIYRWAGLYREGKLGPRFRKSKAPAAAPEDSPDDVVVFQPGTQLALPPPKRNGQHANGHVQLGRATTLQDQLMMAHAEIARLKSQLRKVMNLVVDDE